MVVQPKSSTTYGLAARSFGVRAQLGSVQLTVDPRVLLTFEMLNPQSLLEGALDRSISQMPGMYVRTPSTLRFTQGRISFKLNLGKDVDKFPDPTIKIDGSFGLDVEDGNLVSRSATAVAQGDLPQMGMAAPGRSSGALVHHQRRGNRDTGPGGAVYVIREHDEPVGVPLGHGGWNASPQRPYRRTRRRVGHDRTDRVPGGSPQAPGEGNVSASSGMLPIARFCP